MSHVHRPYNYHWQPPEKHLSLKVHKKLPKGFTQEMSFGNDVKEARNAKYEHMYFCPHRECNGWIDGLPTEHEVHTMSQHHPLSGRDGTEYYCHRCGQEIGFIGMVA